MYDGELAISGLLIKGLASSGIFVNYFSCENSHLSPLPAASGLFGWERGGTAVFVRLR